jgi:flagellar biosynthesis GTPase FlhF
VIEKRKEQAEAMMLEAEREEERKKVAAAREQELLEERRRREEAARREKERLERELEEQEMEEARQLLEQTRRKGKAGALVRVVNRVHACKLRDHMRAVGVRFSLGCCVAQNLRLLVGAMVCHACTKRVRLGSSLRYRDIADQRCCSLREPFIAARTCKLQSTAANTVGVSYWRSVTDETFFAVALCICCTSALLWLQPKDGDKLDRKALMQEALSERLKEAQVRHMQDSCCLQLRLAYRELCGRSKE